MNAINGPLDEGAMNNPEAMQEGITKARRALPKKYQAIILGPPIKRNEIVGGGHRTVFPVINKSTVDKTIVEHLAEIEERFGGHQSVAYIFFRNEEDKVYYTRIRGEGLCLQRFNPAEGQQIVLKAQNPCNRCMGTGVYQARSRVTYIRYGNRAPVCFGCDGTGDPRSKAYKKNGGK